MKELVLALLNKLNVDKKWRNVVVSILIALGLGGGTMVAVQSQSLGPVWPTYTDRLCSFDNLTCPAWLSLSAGGDLQAQADDMWVGTGTDAYWSFNSATDKVETLARETSLQSPEDSTTTPVVDIDKRYTTAAGTVYAFDSNTIISPSAGTAQFYGGRFYATHTADNPNVPLGISGLIGDGVVLSGTSASYLYGVRGSAQSYGDQAGAFSNVVEGVLGSATIGGEITGHAYGVSSSANCYGANDGGAVPGLGCDANSIRAYKGIVDNTFAGQIDSAEGIYVDIVNRDTSVITAAIGVHTALLLNDGTVKTNTGVQIDTPISAGTLTTNYGLYIYDQNVGTTKYSIYVAGSAPISMLSGQSSTGQYGIAMGRNARSTQTGAIVFSDSTATNFTSPAQDTFSVRATGGSYFGDGGMHLYKTETAKTANYTILVADRTTTFSNKGATGEITFTLPSAAVGLNNCIYVFAAYTVTIKPGGSDQIHALTDAADNRIQNVGTAGDYVCFEAIDSTYWAPLPREGTWSDIN